ncbi:MAG: sensor histidine kinase [Sandaracinaceae bacterium]|nr:sensor histidine kinase [Sandaracinaceae bacterium]
MSSRLDHLVPPLFRAVPPQSPQDEATFDDYAATLARQLGLMASVVMAFFTLAWWPLDLVVIPRPEHVPVFAALRWRALSVVLTGVVVFGVWKPSGNSALLAATTMYAAFSGAIGYSLGAAGPEGLQWFADAAIAIIPVAFIPLRLGARVLASTLVSGTLVGSYMASNVDNITTPGFGSQVSFQVFAVLLSIAVGELWLRVTRHAFFQQLATQRANAELAALTASLSDLVRERTRELQALAQHLSSVQESERRRIARDLHDDLGQSMTAMRYALARLSARAQRTSGEPLDLLVADLAALLDGSTQSLRAVVASLSPRILEDHGLEAAAEWLCERIGEGTSVACVLESRCARGLRFEALDPRVALTVFRALQETTNNALKHSGATSIHVALALNAQEVTLAVTDDGCGFDAEAETLGFGIMGLRERVHELDGELRLTAEPGGGLKVLVRVPCASEVTS